MGTSFYDNKTLEEAKIEAISGNPATAKKAHDLLNKLGAATIETTRRRRRSSVMGSRVCVPAYLSGAPNPMRRYVQEADTSAPLSIVVNGSSSGNISSRDLFNRGIAIAAMVQKMSLARPVTLHLAVTGKPYGSMATPSTIALVKFPTTPIDLTRLAHLMADQGFNRGIGFAAYFCMVEKYLTLIGDKSRKGVISHHSIHWPFESYDYISKSNGDSLERDLQAIMPGDVLYLSGSLSGSTDFRKCLDNPIEWINETVKKYTKL